MLKMLVPPPSPRIPLACSDGFRRISTIVPRFQRLPFAIGLDARCKELFPQQTHLRSVFLLFLGSIFLDTTPFTACFALTTSCGTGTIWPHMLFKSLFETARRHAFLPPHRSQSVFFYSVRFTTSLFTPLRLAGGEGRRGHGRLASVHRCEKVRGGTGRSRARGRAGSEEEARTAAAVEGAVSILSTSKHLFFAHVLIESSWGHLVPNLKAPSLGVLGRRWRLQPHSGLLFCAKLATRRDP